MNETLHMHRLTSFSLALILVSLLNGKQSYAVLERFNIGVGYGGADELSISTDSPGEFDYKLRLRTANNTESWANTHYTGVENLHRTIRLHCGTNELDSVDNPETGTCISGGPFVRGAFVAGNGGRYAVVKMFNLFCGSIQVADEKTTNNWNSDFDTNVIENFLNNSASSTWCPTSPSPTATPIAKNTIKPTVTPKKIKKPSLVKSLSPTAKFSEQTIVTKTPTPTPVATQGQIIEPKSDDRSTLWIALGAGIVLSILVGTGFLKRNSIKTFLSSLDKNKEEPISSTISQVEQDESIHS